MKPIDIGLIVVVASTIYGVICISYIVCSAIKLNIEFKIYEKAQEEYCKKLEALQERMNRLN